MVIEVSRLIKSPVLDATGREHGTVDTCVFTSDEGRLYGFQVARGSMLTRFLALRLDSVLSVTHKGLIIDQEQDLGKDLKGLDVIAKKSGKVLGVKAKTESGKTLGKISDLLIDADTGFIVRFYIRNLLMERIIPRQYLVSITPREIVFKDVVDTPIFDQVAASEALSPT